MKVTLREIGALVGGEVMGDPNTEICSIASIDTIMPGCLVFADGIDNFHMADSSLAAAILVPETLQYITKPLVRVAHPLKAFIQLLNHFYPPLKPKPSIHKTAIIDSNTSIGRDVYIGPYVTISAGAKIGDACIIKDHVCIGENVVIGADTILHPHVTIYENCQIGARVSIHAGSVIGSDGFGYTYVDGKHLKVPHLGAVSIHDDVEIGANTVIDRATLGATVVGEGTKIDNFVQVAHSVKLGKHNILCAFTGIAGSTTSGDNVIFAANVGVSDHVRIDDGVILGARAGVPPKKHLKKGNIYLGNPARPKNKAIEHELSLSRIPLIRKNLNNLSEKVQQISRVLEQET